VPSGWLVDADTEGAANCVHDYRTIYFLWVKLSDNLYSDQDFRLVIYGERLAFMKIWFLPIKFNHRWSFGQTLPGTDIPDSEIQLNMLFSFFGGLIFTENFWFWRIRSPRVNQPNQFFYWVGTDELHLPMKISFHVALSNSLEKDPSSGIHAHTKDTLRWSHQVNLNKWSKGHSSSLDMRCLFYMCLGNNCVDIDRYSIYLISCRKTK